MHDENKKKELNGSTVAVASSLKNKVGIILKEEGGKLLETFITARTIAFALVFWVSLSVFISIYIAFSDKCDKPMVQAGKYFMTRLLCEEKK